VKENLLLRYRKYLHVELLPLVKLCLFLSPYWTLMFLIRRWHLPVGQCGPAFLSLRLLALFLLMLMLCIPGYFLSTVFGFRFLLVSKSTRFHFTGFNDVVLTGIIEVLLCTPEHFFLVLPQHFIIALLFGVLTITARMKNIIQARSLLTKAKPFIFILLDSALLMLMMNTF
jgi:hypothetical protein